MDLNDVYENLGDINPTKKRRVLIVFDDMIADMECNKKLCPKVTELLLRGRKLNISLTFMSQSYFKVPKTIRLNVTIYFIMKTPNKKELQQVMASNHLCDIDFNDFMKLYKEYTKQAYSFLVSDKLYHQITQYNLGRAYYKLSISEKNKTIDNKIEQNKAQYNLDRQTANISAVASGNVSKYEFLTGKDVFTRKRLARKSCNNEKI